jgi:hypothetical protein
MTAADRVRAMTDEQVAAFQAEAADVLTATTSPAFVAALRAATTEEIRRLVLSPAAERTDACRAQEPDTTAEDTVPN